MLEASKMISAAAAAFLAAIPAAAAPSPAPIEAEPEDQSAIIVTGTRNVDQEMRAFVGALTAIPSWERLSRFERSVCPLVLGLPQGQADRVAARIRRVAGHVGIRVGGVDCTANVIVAVTSDKRVFLEEIHRRYGDYFGNMPQRKVRQLIRQPGPAAAWQIQGPPVSSRGVELAYDQSMETYVNQTTEPASRLESGARPQFAAAMVVVERQALAGLTTTQLADYAAMRALSGADPARLGNSNAPTILRVLEAPMGTAVPITMTAWDIGFLRGLYSASYNLNNSAQRTEIRKRLAKELEAKPSE